jgi:hypothetical protein
MTVLHYSAGNENNPGNPWGRTELAIQADGKVHLDHYPSRATTLGAWSGRIDPTAVDAIRAGLERAGFPATPPGNVPPGSSFRQLSVGEGEAQRRAWVEWHAAAKLPGYAELFDLLDGVVRQLSGGVVPYPSTNPVAVSDITVG